jgi:L-seryl-tRNA(Ser) seleniumtransferase
MSLAALEATLILHRDSPDRVPVRRMLAQSETVLQRRAECLQAMLQCGVVEPTDGFAGGGALPEARIASRAITFQPRIGATEAAARLRGCDPPVIGRIKDGRLVIDLLAVAEADLPELAACLRTVLA